MTAPLTKTIVATGASSGLGFELIKSLLLTQPTPSLLPNPTTDRYNLILGARDVPRTRAAYDALGYDGARHRLTVLPLELSDLRGTRAFAREVGRLLAGSGSSSSASAGAAGSAGSTSAGEGGEREGGGGGQEAGTVLDYLLLNAAISGGDGAETRVGFAGWNEAVVVNHFAQHYLVHLLEEKLVESKTRVVMVSSGAVRRVTETASLDKDLKAGSGVDIQLTYSQTKLVQLLGAHWWRRQLKGQCIVVAVSPGLIPGTGLTRGMNLKLTMDMPDAKPVDEGARSILRAFTRDDFPEDPEQIFLTSWGEWWSKDMYAPTLDQALQDKWCPSKDELEREAGLSG